MAHCGQSIRLLLLPLNEKYHETFEHSLKQTGWSE